LASDSFTQHLQGDYRTSNEQYAMYVWQQSCAQIYIALQILSLWAMVMTGYGSEILIPIHNWNN
jgi:hypothetical protein